MNIFNVFPKSRPKGNMFNLSHEKKLTFNYGELIPAYLQDVIPGDKFTVSSEIMMRLAPLLSPVMHRVNVFMHFFFVPNRLVWNNWEDFITGGVDGTDDNELPYTQTGTSAYWAIGSLADYMGIPYRVAPTYKPKIQTLPFRAYQKIYNEFYRDPNLTTEIPVPTGDSVTESYELTLRKRCWEKDYFTSALPWSQRGGDVNLPLEGDINWTPTLKDPALTADGINGNIQVQSGQIRDSGLSAMQIDAIDSDVYELENVSLTINDLRQSVRLQEWLEKNARGGGRYVEQILSHFGVVSSDARLQRPEYLGGSRQPVVISEVLATADSGSYDPGSLLGHGISVGAGNRFSKRFEEHGYVIGILSVLPRTAYQDGVPRDFLKLDKFDFYFPEFANLGEQEIFNAEVYWDKDNDTNYDTFGYAPRYAEYKYKPSSVHGEFKSSLTYWHMGRIFSSAPALNTSFVELDHTTAGVHRVHQVTDSGYDKLYCQIFHNVKAWRPMPKYSLPRL